MNNNYYGDGNQPPQNNGYTPQDNSYQPQGNVYTTQDNSYQLQNNGYQPNYYQPPQPLYNAPEDPGKGSGTASMVLGIIGLCMSWFYGSGTIIGIVGVILAVISGNKSKSAGLNRNGLATAGLVCSIIAIILGSIGLICTIIACTTLTTAVSSGYYSYW